MYKLLVVDDEPFIRQGLRLLIHEKNDSFEVSAEAANAFEALELLKNQYFDAAMIDIKMPKMDGLTLIRKIRAKGLLNLPIIILSGFFDYSYAKNAMDCDVITYLLKPIQPNELEQALFKVQEQINQQKLQKARSNKYELHSVMSYVNQMVCGSYEAAAEQKLRQYFHKAKRFYYLRLVWEQPQESGFEHKLLNHNFFQQMYLQGAVPIQIPGRAEDASPELGLVITNLVLATESLTPEEYAARIKNDLQRYEFGNVGIYLGQRVNAITQLSKSYRTASSPLSEIENCSGAQLLPKVEEYLLAHFREPISVSSLSKYFYINKAYLGQLFKKQYGMYLKDYLNKLRCKEAAQLLINGDEKIYRIAQETGFSNVDHFIQVFTRETGLTPNKYRKNQTVQNQMLKGGNECE